MHRKPTEFNMYARTCMAMPQCPLDLLLCLDARRFSAWTLACTIAVVGISLLLTLHHFRTRRLCLPPGPRPLPFLGNLHQLLLVKHLLPHHALAHLSKKHGPLMSLRMGSRLALFVSSSGMAKEFLQESDRYFASRPRFEFCERLLYGHQNGIAFSMYGARWRKMRRICTLELFTAKRMMNFQKIAEEELALLVDDINLICRSSANGSVEINVAHLAHLVVSNIMGRFVLGKRMCSTYGNLDDEQSLLDMFQMTNQAIIPAMTDFLPFLIGPLLDWKSRHNMHRIHNRINTFWEAILDERRKHRQNQLPNPPMDFLDVLLSSNEVSELGDDNVKATLMDILGAGSETSAITIEWVMSELLRNPDCMLKLQGEMDTACPTMDSLPVSSTSWLHPISGSQWARKSVLTSSTALSSAIAEAASSVSSMSCLYLKWSHIAGASYLKSVLKETLRLHPPVPLLIPRASNPGSAKCHFGKFTFVDNIMLFVNAWAIGRDEENWERPEEFRPDRFDGKICRDGSSFNWSNTDCQLIPFGAGRRRCPGMALSLCMMELTVATFVRAFHWELPNKQVPGDMNMNEKSGSAGTHKAHPLIAILTPSSPSLLNQYRPG